MHMMLWGFLIMPLLIGSFFALLMSKWGMQLGFVDAPNERSSRTVETPRGGGIGIWLVAVSASLCVSHEKILTIAVIGIGLVSLLEDRFSLPRTLRLFMHLLFGLLISVMYLGMPHSLSAVLLRILWMLIIMCAANWYNFMDGINGIAGITGAVGFGMLSFYACNISYDFCIGYMSLLIAVSCIGFLFFNIPRARVFMGDVGSVVLGFVFAVFMMLLSKQNKDTLCIASFLLPFFADAISTMLVRIKNKENIFKPHRSHLYQILANEAGIAHWKVSAGYGMLQMLVGCSMIAGYNKGWSFGFLSMLLSTWCMLFIVVSFYVRRKWGTIKPCIAGV